MSYHANALGRPDGLLTPHQVYLEQAAGYRALFERVLSREQLMEIRRGTEKGIGIGRADFLLKVAKLAGG